jgi:uncharacterized protein YbjT (DUF2867 family)
MKIAVVGATGRVGRHVVDVLEIACPQEESLVEAARRLVARRGDAIRIEGVGDPADPGAALYESGALLPSPDAILAGPTFDAWLARTFQ